MGLAPAWMGSHERLWELLLRWEVAPGTAPGSFVPKSQLVLFCCGATESLPWMGMCRGLTAQPGTAPEPSPVSGHGAEWVAGCHSERDARGHWYPPSVVSCHPPVRGFPATKLLPGCL